MGIEFTREQQAVIDARNSNILVSAAAGSGKTAVLVERIIQMMGEGLDIDHLLVVTFTRAAASQMKEKITAAIHEKLSEDPENAHFQRQETLIHNAQITTIDSFCQYVVRNNFNTIGLDPSYRVGDEGELKLLSEEVLNDLLEQEYDRAAKDEDSDFIYCMDYFSQSSSDRAVSEYINTLYKFSRSMPWPEDWLKQRLHDYETTDRDFDELDFVKACMELAKDILGEAASRLELALKLASEPDGPYMYADQFESELNGVQAALNSRTYDESFDLLRNISFDRLPGCRDKSVNGDKKELAQKMRVDAKDAVGKLVKDFFGSRSTGVKEKMAYCDRAVRELVRLTLEFADRFAEVKRERHIIDFSDMEHFALQILVDHPSEEVSTPSVVALEYRDYYREVLIDEYQDSNSVQEMILKAISGEDPKVSERFMVGDVKQSIYKFRLARPEIFMEKFASFDKAEGAENRRIDLHKNFRSRKEILDITNYIFCRIMGSDLGKVDYDSDARLVYGADYKEPLLDVTPELLLVDDAEDDGSSAEELTQKEKEVAVIASRIRELMRENPALSYKDIVILLRSPSGWVDVLKKGLSDNGIPAYMESKSGYFTSYEVSVLLNVMSVIDNPRQNIELISVMKSPVGGFTDEELARIKICLNSLEDPELRECYFLGMKSGLNLESELSDKISGFVALIEKFRTMSTYVPVHELLQLFLNETDFETIVTAMPYGNQRRANIELLLNDAANFEKTSFKGLFHFVRYIEHLKDSQVDYGEAGVIDENADVVRIMSIHKSKGLEFPVVFVAGMGQRLNFRDSTGNFILDMDLGLGVKYINSELGIKSDTLKRAVIADCMKTESLGEELRVLYVALTRAKEKLIMTAGVKDLSKKVTEQLALIASLGKSGELLPYGKRKSAQCYLDLVLPAVFLHSSMKEIFDRYEIPQESYSLYCDEQGKEPALKIRAMSANDITVLQLADEAVSEIRRKELETPAADTELEEQLVKRLGAEYSHPELTGLFTKTTVTELKKKMLEEAGEFDAHEASFAGEREEQGDKESASKDRLTGAERGTAYHRIMELLDGNIYGDENLTSKSRKEVCTRLDKWIEKLVSEGIIPETYRDCVDTGDVAIFLFTDLGKRMAAAYRNGKLMTEKPFMMGVAASELDEKFPKSETVLVQGIVDAWFIEGEDIILMDYKTDKVREDKDLTDRYSIQLKLYKRALEAATGMKVKEIFIYSFALGRQIQLSV